ncbi:MAG: M4 family metallopeptidase, partial [Chloroflexales bacterium]|nr:M4 family metallopeptidase [Chloroflexales bacterium]
GPVRIARHSETGSVRFLAADVGQALSSPSLAAPSASPEQVARAFLAEYGQIFGIRNQEGELSLMRSVAGGAASTFVRFQQRHAGVPVLGGELVAQVRAGGVATVSGEALPNLAVDTTPTITPEQARTRALAAIAHTYKLDAASLRVSAPALWIFNPALLGGPGPRINTLVWRLEVRNESLTEPVRELVLVDAQSGRIALHFNQIAHGKVRLVCDAQGKGDTDGDENTSCDEPGEFVRGEGQGATGVTDTDLAYDYAGLTYDYFQISFGRDSLDGKGMPLISLVRYCPSASDCPYGNAFWNGRQMTYGTGYASADDVVAHELSHGFTEFSSSLFYYYQSGAINESMSDVFGELVDLIDGAGNDSPAVRWQLGEDLPPSVGVIRDIRNPPLFDNPDRTGSSLYYGGPQDSGGVHSNSGVNNKALYLMVDGGTFNGQTVAGIGAEKAGQIYYLVNNALLVSASDYLDLADALPTACRTLIGVRGISAADCEQVVKAVVATEMNKTPVKGAVPAPVPACAAGKVPKDLFFDNMENAQSGNWVFSSLNNTVQEWYYGSAVPPPLGPIVYATSGKSILWGNDYGLLPDDPNALEAVPTDYAAAMANGVTIPADAFLHFQHAHDFEIELGDGTAYDGGVVEYSTDGGTTWQDAGALFTDNGYNTTVYGVDQSDNPLAGRNVFGDVSRGYYASKAALTQLVDKNVKFRFRIGTDALNPLDQAAYGWFIDDVRVYTCVDRPTYRVFMPTVAR